IDARGRSIGLCGLDDWRSPAPGYAMPLAATGGVLLLAGIIARVFLPGALGAAPESGEGKRIRSLGNIALLAGIMLGVIGLLRIGAPQVLRNAGWATKNPEPFLVPTGVVLMLAGLMYGLVSVGFWSDDRLVVMVRREFTAFFYSPIAYIVLFGFTFMGGLSYYLFLYRISRLGAMGRPLEEPIVQEYIIGFIPVVAVMVAVPV